MSKARAGELTADTITVKQIREVGDLMRDGAVSSARGLHLPGDALYARSLFRRRDARRVCAEILNAHFRDRNSHNSRRKP